MAKHKHIEPDWELNKIRDDMEDIIKSEFKWEKNGMGQIMVSVEELAKFTMVVVAKASKLAEDRCFEAGERTALKEDAFKGEKWRLGFEAGQKAERVKMEDLIDCGEGFLIDNQSVRSNLVAHEIRNFRSVGLEVKKAHLFALPVEGVSNKKQSTVEQEPEKEVEK